MPRIFSQEDGVTTYFDYDHLTDNMHFTAVQDATPLLDAMHGKRTQERWNKEVKEDWVHFASIPPIVELELRQKGINIHDKNCTTRLMKEIQSNYPYLLAHYGKRFA